MDIANIRANKEQKKMSYGEKTNVVVVLAHGKNEIEYINIAGHIGFNKYSINNTDDFNEVF